MTVRAGAGDLRARLSVAGRASLLVSVAPIAASFVTQAWLARRFERVGLGEYHATGLFVAVLTTILLFGFPTAASQRIASLEERGSERVRLAKETTFAIAGLLGLVLAVLGLAAWPAFGRLFAITATPPGWLIAGAMLGGAISIFAVHMLLAELRMRTVTLLVLAQPAGVALGIVMTSAGAPLEAAHLAAIGFVASGAAAIAQLLGDGILPRPHADELRHLARSAAPATIVLYPTVLTGWVDRTIIGIVVGPSALGAYVAASALVDALQRVARGIGAFSVPAYARLAADPVGAQRVLESQLRITSAMFLLAGSVFIAAGSGMLSLIFGEGFGIAGTTLRLLAIALLPLGVSLVVASHVVGIDPLRASSRILVLLLPLHLVLGVVLTALFSIAGTALANLIVWSMGVLLYGAHARREHASLPWRPLMHIAGVGIPLFVASWYIGLQPIPWQLRATASLILAIPIVLVVIIREAERRVLRRVVSRAGTLPGSEAEAP